MGLIMSGADWKTAAARAALLPLPKNRCCTFPRPPWLAGGGGDDPDDGWWCGEYGERGVWGWPTGPAERQGGEAECCEVGVSGGGVSVKEELVGARPGEEGEKEATRCDRL